MRIWDALLLIELVSLLVGVVKRLDHRQRVLPYHSLGVLRILLQHFLLISKNLLVHPVKPLKFIFQSVFFFFLDLINYWLDLEWLSLLKSRLRCLIILPIDNSRVLFANHFVLKVILFLLLIVNLF